ncbi:MAG: hypothetical protein SOT71_11570 [Romboutsia timonensis]|nr:hypothetical protein [Romboutsia timonensis]
MIYECIKGTYFSNIYQASSELCFTLSFVESSLSSVNYIAFAGTIYKFIYR